MTATLRPSLRKRTRCQKQAPDLIATIVSIPMRQVDVRDGRGDLRPEPQVNARGRQQLQDEYGLGLQDLDHSLMAEFRHSRRSRRHGALDRYALNVRSSGYLTQQVAKV